MARLGLRRGRLSPGPLGPIFLPPSPGWGFQHPELAPLLAQGQRWGPPGRVFGFCVRCRPRAVEPRPSPHLQARLVFLGLAVRPDAPTPHWGAGCGVPSRCPAFAPVDEEDSGAPAPSPGPTRPAWGSREERGPSKVILPHQPQAGPGGGGPGERGSRRGGPLVSREEPRRGAAGPRGHGLSTQKCSTPKTCAFSV